MCTQLGIARSGYYKWLHREKPEQEKENELIAELVKEYDEKFGHILGYRRMTNWINTFNHKQYNRKRIHRIMKKLNIHSVIRRKKVNRTYSRPEKIAENILKRNFEAMAPNEKWTTDVTEFKIPTSDMKIYLSAIIDLYDKTVLAYEISKRNNNHLVFKTYDQAISLNPDAKPIFHSDRGFQYTSQTFQNKLKEQGIQQSMSRVSCCIDNGPTEGFWGILKSEMYAMYDIKDEHSLVNAINNYIYFYNNERLQERYGNQTPMAVRKKALDCADPQCYPIPENKRIKKYKAKFTA